jgi:hypothetical protein
MGLSRPVMGMFTFTFNPFYRGLCRAYSRSEHRLREHSVGAAHIRNNNLSSTARSRVTSQRWADIMPRGQPINSDLYIQNLETLQNVE